MQMQRILITHDFHHIQHDDPEEPPRRSKSGDSKQTKAKREKAQNHDLMILRLTQQLMRFHARCGAETVLENPGRKRVKEVVYANRRERKRSWSRACRP